MVRQVPELQKLIELREALVALKGPLGNMPAFRQRLEQILEDENARQKLMEELQSIEAREAEKLAAEPKPDLAGKPDGEIAVNGDDTKGKKD